MAKERESRPMSSFFKFNQLGDMVAGVVREFKNSSNGPFAIVGQAVIRNGRKGAYRAFASVAVGMSTDVQSKLDQSRDVGKIVLVQFDSTEPTTKGSDKKIFKVLDLEKSELDKLFAQSDKSGERSVYQADAPAKSQQSDLDEFPSDGEDDLPF